VQLVLKTPPLLSAHGLWCDEVQNVLRHELDYLMLMQIECAGPLVVEAQYSNEQATSLEWDAGK
jgi:hypothetical protein